MFLLNREDLQCYTNAIQKPQFLQTQHLQNPVYGIWKPVAQSPHLVNHSPFM